MLVRGDHQISPPFYMGDHQIPGAKKWGDHKINFLSILRDPMKVNFMIPPILYT